MAYYTPKTWQDRSSQYPMRRTLTFSDNSTSVATVERNEGTVSIQGDAFSATNMNNLENRIQTAFATVEDTVGDIASVLDEINGEVI